jgi:hypothetical protein
LKELQISHTTLEEFPDLVGISKDNFESDFVGDEEESKPLMNSLEKLEIKIRGEKCISRVFIHSTDYPGLKSLKLHGMENLVELSLIGMETLSYLDIRNCPILKTLMGISELKNIEMLNISECPDLEFNKLCLREMKYLKKVSLDSSVKVRYFELEAC